MKELTKNPWLSVREWEEFLYFCCPECNEKNQSKDIFIKHALSIHPMAQICFESIESDIQLKETYRINENGFYINEEYSEEANACEQKLKISMYEDPLVIVKNEVIEQSESEVVYNFYEENDMIDVSKHDEWQNTKDDYDELIGANINLKQPIVLLHKIDAMENLGKVKVKRRRRCGKCDGCNQDNCGQCTSCLDKVQFGGPGLKKRCCIKRKCSKVKVKREGRCGECDGCNQNNCGQCKSCLDKVQFGGPGLKKRGCIKRKCLNGSGYHQLTNPDLPTPQKNKSEFMLQEFDDENFEYQNAADTNDTKGKNIMRQGNHSEIKCNLCNKVFSKKSYLIFHVSVDHPETNYADAMDGIDLDQKDPNLHFEKHETFIKKPIKTITYKSFKEKETSKLFTEAWDRIIKNKCETCGNEKCFTCHICNLQFPSKSNTLRHIAQEHKEERPYKCEFCSLDFNVISHLKGHIIGVHEKKNQEKKWCEICKKSVNLFYFNRHIQVIHENKPLKRSTCPICNKTFHGYSYLKIHIKAIHEKIKSWKCKFEGCSRDFAFQEAYLIHMRAHEGIKLLCDICGEERTQRNELRSHKTRKHEDEINAQYKDKGLSFPCTICEKVLFSSQLLKNHLQFIHNLMKDEIENNGKNCGEKLEKAIKCEFCDDTFNYQSILKNHVKVVHNANQFSCEYCGKVSSSARNLDRHIESIHKGSTKCTCTICGKVFRDTSVMKFHVRTVHEKIKDFVCEECGKGFSKKLGLKSHLAQYHSIGSTFDCQECGKKFGKNFGLKLHTDTVHRGIKHQCDQCTSSFTQKGNLRLHIQKHHS